MILQKIEIGNEIETSTHHWFSFLPFWELCFQGMNKVRKSARIPAAPVLADEETLGTNVTNGWFESAEKKEKQIQTNPQFKHSIIQKWNLEVRPILK